jgi:hypothetical protein
VLINPFPDIVPRKVIKVSFLDQCFDNCFLLFLTSFCEIGRIS